jgi:hypothetical protein
MRKRVVRNTTKTRSLSKELLLPKTFIYGSKVSEPATSKAAEAKSKAVDTSKLLIKNQTELNIHKRTVSDFLPKPAPEALFSNFPATFCQKLRKKLLKSKNQDDKIRIILYFMESLTKLNTSFSEILKIISDTVRDYQKYIKNLDSTRIENNEIAVETKNSIFSQNLYQKIHYKSSKAPKSSADPSNSREVMPDFQKLSACNRRQSSYFPPNPSSLVDSIPKVPLQKSLISKLKPVPSLQLGSISSTAYHEEFMEKFDEFSDSWKEEILKHSHPYS